MPAEVRAAMQRFAAERTSWLIRHGSWERARGPCLPAEDEGILLADQRIRLASQKEGSLIRSLPSKWRALALGVD